MRTDSNPDRRDAVLFAFGEAHPRPTAAEVAAWVERHRDLENDIRAQAVALLAVADEPCEPSPALVARGRARALDIVAAARAKAEATGTNVRFADLMAAAGTDVPRLARALDVGRATLVDLVQGRMRLPAPRRLVVALAEALGASAEGVGAAMAAAAAAPQMGSAKATVTPTARARNFAEIVRADATMNDERKAFWLSVAED